MSGIVLWHRGGWPGWRRLFRRARPYIVSARVPLDELDGYRAGTMASEGYAVDLRPPEPEGKGDVSARVIARDEEEAQLTLIMELSEWGFTTGATRATLEEEL